MTWRGSVCIKVEILDPQLVKSMRVTNVVNYCQLWENENENVSGCLAQGAR